jgi:hypothetical protein
MAIASFNCRRLLGAWLAGVAGLIGTTGAVVALDLDLPIACQIGTTCFIQQYMDVGGPDGPRDYRCGTATYKGHSGLDIRAPSAASAQRNPIAVVAAADGVVLRVRDGVRDVFVREIGRDAVNAVGCGNAAVVSHGQGWETLYCHMKQGSVAVKPGDRVQRGQRLGDVGYSGLADMAHVHFQVMHQGKVVDPFTGKAPDGTCALDAGASGSMWTAAAARALTYQSGQILTVGFSPAGLTPEMLEADDVPAPVTIHSPAILFFARVIDVRPGDAIRLRLLDPAGAVIVDGSSQVDRAQAVTVRMAGRKADQTPIAAGIWRGAATLLRGNVVVSTATGSVEVR